MSVRIHDALGLCQKAGRCQSGDYAAENAVKAGKAFLVVLDGRASDNTRDKYAALCGRREVPLVLVDGVGHAIGREGRIVVAVTDRNFAKMIGDAAKPQMPGQGV